MGAGQPQLLRMLTTWLYRQEQVVKDRPGHFAQVVRGKYEFLCPRVHGRFKREHFSGVKQMGCVFNGFVKRNPGVYTKQLQMAFVLPAVCEGLKANGCRLRMGCSLLTSHTIGGGIGTDGATVIKHGVKPL